MGRPQQYKMGSDESEAVQYPRNSRSLDVSAALIVNGVGLHDGLEVDTLAVGEGSVGVSA